jgi:hypothetical protein
MTFPLIEFIIRFDNEVAMLHLLYAEGLCCQLRYQLSIANL